MNFFTKLVTVKSIQDHHEGGWEKAHNVQSCNLDKRNLKKLKY